ncbi:MAG TPA: Ig-like domain-containing protein, partial [Enhygromyxa sp.]|nr:Ig-like domain-containing protein [Enhygromyxa sp.]
MSKHSHRVRLVGFSAIVIACATVGLAFIASDEAVAGPGDVPATADDLAIEAPTLDVATHLTAEDLWDGEVTRLSIPLTPEEMGVDAETPPQIPVGGPTYIFVNMDGANLTCNGGDSSTANASIIACQYGFSGPYPSYGGTQAQRQTVMDAVMADWAPFNMVITDVRPASGPYTMCMTGPANHPFGNGVLGIAPLDCNNYVANNVVFAFHSASQLGGFLGANTQATTISQEVAHAYGLEHVGSSSDIMNPTNQGGNPSFTNNCIQIVSQNGIVCGQQHQQYCNNGYQNSYQELLGMFGASDPDDQPPSVTVAYPYDGDVFAPGADFVIECQASDNQAVDAVELWINGSKEGATLGAPPFEWDVTDIPIGTFDIHCVATDGWDNTAMSSVVSIVVEEGGMPGDDGADSGDEGDSGSNDDSGGDSGDSADDSGG